MTIELSPTNREDTIANHGTRTSGNAAFISVRPVRTLKKPEDIADIAKDIRKLDVSYVSADAKTLGEFISEVLEETERYPIVLTPSPPVGTDIRVLIDRETDKLDVLSDSIGPALLSLLNIHGPLSTSQILESLDITIEVLTSHLETLERTSLVTLEDSQYSISEEGIDFLRSLELEEV